MRVMRVSRMRRSTESTWGEPPGSILSMYHGMIEMKSTMFAKLIKYFSKPGPAGDVKSRIISSTVKTMMQKVSISPNGVRLSTSGDCTGLCPKER